MNKNPDLMVYLIEVKTAALVVVYTTSRRAECEIKFKIYFFLRLSIAIAI